MASLHRPLAFFKRMRSALVVLCLVAFSVVNIVHAAHHVAVPSQTAALAAVAPSDANDPADAASELAETCLVCALVSAPIELFVLSAPTRVAIDVATVSRLASPARPFTEAPPPRA